MAAVKDDDRKEWHTEHGGLPRAPNHSLRAQEGRPGESHVQPSVPPLAPERPLGRRAGCAATPRTVQHLSPGHPRQEGRSPSSVTKTLSCGDREEWGLSGTLLGKSITICRDCQCHLPPVLSQPLSAAVPVICTPHLLRPTCLAVILSHTSHPHNAQFVLPFFCSHFLSTFCVFSTKVQDK